MKWHAVLLCAVAFAVGDGAFAQEKYPSRNINVIVPITAGSAVDILARLYADRLPKVLGVPVLVSNQPGASGIIAPRPCSARRLAGGCDDR